MKKLCFVLCMLALVLAETSLEAPHAFAKKTLKMTHMLNPGNSMSDSMDHFAKLVAEKSKGELNVQIYPAPNSAAISPPLNPF